MLILLSDRHSPIRPFTIMHVFYLFIAFLIDICDSGRCIKNMHTLEWALETFKILFACFRFPEPLIMSLLYFSKVRAHICYLGCMKNLNNFGNNSSSRVIRNLSD